MLTDYDPSQYKKMSVAVDLLVFTIEEDRLKLLMIEREEEPFAGKLALPGVFVGIDETLDAAAKRGIREETGLKDIYFEQLYTFGDPARSHGGVPMVSVCYWALVGQADVAQLEPRHNVQWFADDDLPPLAFDHRAIVDYALWRLRHRMDSPRVVRQLVGEPFTLRQLHALTEAIRGERVDVANSRRRMLASGLLEETGGVLREGRQRPAALYRFRPGALDDAGAPWLPAGCEGEQLEHMNTAPERASADDNPLGSLTTALLHD